VPKVSPAHLQARREQILDGARRCFARWGYEGATVARLEEEIDLSRGAIFHYFDSKWELFWALAEVDQTRTLEAFTEGGVDEMMRTLVEGDPDWLGVYFEATSILRRDKKLFEQWTNRTPELQERAQAKFEQLQADGEIRSDVALEELTRFVGTVADGLVIRRSFGLDVDLGALTTLLRSALAPARQ
jgi:TetR/AcrR family transcriptional regulator, transcriptional repressor of aconitase